MAGWNSAIWSQIVWRKVNVAPMVHLSLWVRGGGVNVYYLKWHSGTAHTNSQHCVPSQECNHGLKFHMQWNPDINACKELQNVVKKSYKCRKITAILKYETRTDISCHGISFEENRWHLGLFILLLTFYSSFSCVILFSVKLILSLHKSTIHSVFSHNKQICLVLM